MVICKKQLKQQKGENSYFHPFDYRIGVILVSYEGSVFQKANCSWFIYMNYFCYCLFFQKASKARKAATL